jgi:hypothetical protein
MKILRTLLATALLLSGPALADEAALRRLPNVTLACEGAWGGAHPLRVDLEIMPLTERVTWTWPNGSGGIGKINAFALVPNTAVNKFGHETTEGVRLEIIKWPGGQVFFDAPYSRTGVLLTLAKVDGVSGAFDCIDKSL